MQDDMILKHGIAALALALTAAMVGCSAETSPTGETHPLVSVTPPYPAGPYGTLKGSIIRSYPFNGYQNAQIEHVATSAIVLSDFYNPHADDPTYAPASSDEDDRVFPVGSMYGSGAPKPKALAIVVSSGWCGACKREAKTVLPGKHAQYKPLGGEFLVQLNDGPTPGRSASEQDLTSWTTTFDIDYPATIDPLRQLDALFVVRAYPANIIVDTRTMKIVEVVAGIPSSDFWVLFESTLAGS